MLTKSLLAPRINLDDDSFDLMSSFFPSTLKANGRFNVDAYEKAGTWIIQAALPGIEKDEIELNIEGNILEIMVQRKNDKRKEDENYYIRELSYGSLSRSFALPRNIDKTEPTAELKDGILTITLKKSSKNQIAIT